MKSATIVGISQDMKKHAGQSKKGISFGSHSSEHGAGKYKQVEQQLRGGLLNSNVELQNEAHDKFSDQIMF